MLYIPCMYVHVYRSKKSEQVKTHSKKMKSSEGIWSRKTAAEAKSIWKEKTGNLDTDTLESQSAMMSGDETDEIGEDAVKL